MFAASAAAATAAPIVPLSDSFSAPILYHGIPRPARSLLTLLLPHCCPTAALLLLLLLWLLLLPLRIRCGATVEKEDVALLMDWLAFAYEKFSA